MNIPSRESKSAWLFLSPSLLLYGVYVLFPIIYTFYLSFTDWDGISSFPMPVCLVDSNESCFVNYELLLEDDVFWTSLKNNLLWLGFFSLSPVLGLALDKFEKQSIVARFFFTFLRLDNPAK